MKSKGRRRRPGAGVSAPAANGAGGGGVPAGGRRARGWACAAALGRRDEAGAATGERWSSWRVRSARPARRVDRGHEGRPCACIVPWLADGTAFGGGREVRGRGLGWSGQARDAEEGPAAGEAGVAVMVAEEAGVPNAHEAHRETWSRNRRRNSWGGQRHDLLVIVIGVVLPPEADDAVDGSKGGCG